MPTGARASTIDGDHRSSHLATIAVMTAMLGVFLLQTFPSAPIGSTGEPPQVLAPAVAALMRAV